jgi:hypothetical protein
MTDVEKARAELNKALSIDFSPDEQPITVAVEKLIEAIVVERLANYQTKPLRFR